MGQVIQFKPKPSFRQLAKERDELIKERLWMGRLLSAFWLCKDHVIPVYVLKGQTCHCGESE